MLDGLEEFCRRHEHAIAALEATSTFAAVVLSLFLALMAQRQNRTRLRASVQVNMITHSTLEESEIPTYATASITNLGMMPVSIPMSFFYWKIPFDRGAWNIIPLDYSQADDGVPQKKYPIEIRQGCSETFFLSEMSIFRTQHKSIYSKLTFLDRCRWHFMRAVVVTDDGKVFSAKIDMRLRKELRMILTLSAAADQEQQRDQP
jgi:hypothetical protein